MNKENDRYYTKVEIPISLILETIFSGDNNDVETLSRWAKKYGFVDFDGKYYKLQDDYTKQSFYVLLDKEERKQYDYEDYLIEENEELLDRIDKAIEYINKKWGNWGTHVCEYNSELIKILKGE